MGIQKVYQFSFARCARRNVGTAISATTAGRMPRKMHEGGESRSKSSGNGTTHLFQLIADEDGNVDGKHTRTALGDGYQVEHLVLFYPFVLVHHLFLYQGYHGISTTQGEYANLKEGLK